MAATYDALRLTRGISKATAARSASVGATEQEVHALAYLAAQLATWYAPSLDWGYTFHGTSYAQPFAQTLASTLRALRRSGSIEDRGRVLAITDSGEELLARLENLVSVESREPFITAACDAALLLPTPLVMRALGMEPTIARSGAAQPLLDEAAVNILSEYYDGLTELVGEAPSLLSVTELWLQYLLLTASQDAA